MSQETIFDKILSGSIPCKKVFENSYVLAFHDIVPQAPIHVLIIPKVKLKNLNDASEQNTQVLGEVLLAAKQVAKLLQVDKSGYRLVINNEGDAGQSVDYLHCHLLAGRSLKWPPG